MEMWLCGMWAVGMVELGWTLVVLEVFSKLGDSMTRVHREQQVA